MPAHLIERPEDLTDLDLSAIAPLPPQRRVLMAPPDHYDVTRPDNPHTTGPDGGLNTVDRDRALDQWRALRRTYRHLGIEVVELEAHPGLPDLVFTANTAWPFLDPETGQRCFLPALMRHEGRRGEVPVAARALEGEGYRRVALPAEVGPFEAGGDLVWLGRRPALLGGTGARTSPAALAAVSAIVGVPVVVLELRDPAFYHLDTCLAVLDEQTVAWVPEAFTPRGRALLEALVPELVALDPMEARRGLACNLHGIDGKHVVLDGANTATAARLEKRGLDVVTVDTSEFRKSGGSVYCMKNGLW